jgi:hypothetical protein
MSEPAVLAADDLGRRYERLRLVRDVAPMIDPDFDGDDDLPELNFEPLENYQ